LMISSVSENSPSRKNRAGGRSLTHAYYPYPQAL
jgi:hypothetical protein